MRVGIVGAGAIGGWVAARLAQSGHDVRIFAREETCALLRSGGLLFSGKEGAISTKPLAFTDSDELGVCDLVVLAVKSFALADVAPSVARMLGPDSVLVPMLNGVPWWFMGDETPLTSVDPDGMLNQLLPYHQVVACVVHAAATRTAPNAVTLVRGDRLILGEPGGGANARVDQLATTLRDAGLPGETSDNIRLDVWFKLWGNMTMNPISALTLATADRILDDSLVLDFVAAIMEEAREIGCRIGCPILDSTAERNAVTRKLGAFRTSMLQDVDASRPLELDALLSAPREIAKRVGVATPALDALLGLTRLMATSRGLYGSAG